MNPVHHCYGTCANTFANNNNKNALRGSCSYFSSVLSEVISGAFCALYSFVGHFYLNIC